MTAAAAGVRENDGEVRRGRKKRKMRRRRRRWDWLREIICLFDTLPKAEMGWGVVKNE